MEKLEMVRFMEKEDETLWGLFGPDYLLPIAFRPCTWRGQMYGYVSAAMHFNGDQSKALRGRMDVVKHIKIAGGWLIERPDINLIARRIHGMTPRKHLVWGGKGMQSELVEVGPIVERGMASTPDAFLRYVHQRTGVASPETLTMVWAAISNCINEWLLDGKPLNFSDVFSIYALPLRRNWVQIFLARVPGLRMVYLSTKAKDLIKLAFSSASRWLRCPELMEVHQSLGRPVVRWNLFVSNGAVWDEASLKREQFISSSLGSVGYVRRWANLIGSLEEFLHASASNAVREAEAPCGQILKNGGEGDQCFARGAATALAPPVVVDNDPRGAVSVYDFAIDPHTAEDLERATAKVLGLPVAPPRILDVRPPRGDGRQGHPNGVLVLPPAGSQTPPKTVLAGLPPLPRRVGRAAA